MQIPQDTHESNHPATEESQSGNSIASKTITAASADPEDSNKLFTGELNNLPPRLPQQLQLPL